MYPFIGIRNLFLEHTMISYEPLWETMKRRSVTTYVLRTKYNVPSATIKRLRDNEGVTTHTLNGLCMILDCGLDSILKYEPTEADELPWSPKGDSKS